MLRLINNWILDRRKTRLERCVGRHPWEEGCWPDDVASVQVELDRMADRGAAGRVTLISRGGVVTHIRKNDLP
jgi:hypothetical protein